MIDLGGRVKGDAELSVLFVDEEAITDLNRRFLGKAGPTDVLAFPIDEEPPESGERPPSTGSSSTRCGPRSRRTSTTAAPTGYPRCDRTHGRQAPASFEAPHQHD